MFSKRKYILTPFFILIILGLYLILNCTTKYINRPATLGSILVLSTPDGANIFLDNQDTGKLTLDTLFDVPTGMHQISVSKTGYNFSPSLTIVKVVEGGLTTVNFSSIKRVGAISVDSDPQGAKIILDQVNTQKITPDTLDSVIVGKHIVSVEKQGYRASPSFDTVEVVEDSLITVNFVLVNKVGDVFVNSDTSGAQIILDHLSTGKVTPDTIFDITIGNHILSVTKPGYSSLPDSFAVQVVEDSVTTVNFVLVQNVGGLFVNSTPQDAEIFLNHENSGETTPHLFSDLPEGSYIVSVNKSDYNTFPESVAVQVIKDSAITVDFTLTLKKGSIYVNSSPVGGDIILDHAFTGELTPDTLFDVPTGMHQISVSKAGYIPSPNSITLEVLENQTASASFNLFDINYGFLYVSSTPESSRIIIDNNFSGEYTPHFFLNNIPVGTHIISVSKDGHSTNLPSKYVVNITPTDTVQLDFGLTPAIEGKEAGKLAWDFDLLDDFNNRIILSNYRGYIIIINLWSTDCTPCMNELPYLQEIYEEYQADSVKIFGINDGGFFGNEDSSTVRQIRESLNLTFTLLVGIGNPVVNEYKKDGTPVTLILDRTGVVYYYKLGYSSSLPNTLRAKLNELFGK
jgi:thiol-disulfide isomerase/thioredoxin